MDIEVSIRRASVDMTLAAEPPLRLGCVFTHLEEEWMTAGRPRLGTRAADRAPNGNLR